MWESVQVFPLLLHFFNVFFCSILGVKATRSNGRKRCEVKSIELVELYLEPVSL